ncbi:FAD-binding domain-containing protein [Polaromonas sp.]|uniref:FAD-binding domain-containing protein n=1 Tax=Polaromonas sp. TaxID=1869339 RepID=UPI0037520F58
MTPLDAFPPTREAALARIAAVRPADYARSRNAIEGAVTHLSPYITHGLVNLPEVLAGVSARHLLDVQHKFVFELGWREYFRHVWRHCGVGILASLHQGLLPDDDYGAGLPLDIRQARTGVPAIDVAVRTLYDSGTLHNHARMWLASYLVHLRKVHWRVGADWLYGHLLDGDLASNHLSWQWVAGTGSRKPYLFNADNVARFAPAAWHSPDSVIDTSYEALDRIARQPVRAGPAESVMPTGYPVQVEPPLLTDPSPELAVTVPDAVAVAGRNVWLVHPWNLGELPQTLPADTLVIGVFVADFHQAWPWNERRWHFVASRMAELAAQCWYADAAAIGAALKGARQVRSIDEPHLQPWLASLAACMPAPTLFPSVEQRCDSFSQWWTRALRGLHSTAELLERQQAPGWWTKETVKDQPRTAGFQNNGGAGGI